MNKTIDCPKCKGKMAKGRLYIVASDVTKPDKMFGYVNWEAADESRFGGIYAYRCDMCGYIEYYAERKK